MNVHNILCMPTNENRLFPFGNVLGCFYIISCFKNNIHSWKSKVKDSCLTKM